MLKRKPHLYATLEDLEIDVAELNRMLGDECVLAQYREGTKYVKLVCKFARCPFQHWYNFEKKGDTAVKIKWFRGINQSHSISSHASGETRQL